MCVVLFLPGITNNVGMSLINNQKGHGDSHQYRRTFWVNLAITAGIVVVGAGAVALVGPLLLRLYGKNFTDGYSILLVLVAAAVPEGLTVAMNQVIQSRGKMWLAFFAINIPRDTAIPLVAWRLVPSHGALGLAVGYLSGRLLALCVTALLVLRIGLTLPSEEETTSRGMGGRAASSPMARAS